MSTNEIYPDESRAEQMYGDMAEHVGQSEPCKFCGRYHVNAEMPVCYGCGKVNDQLLPELTESQRAAMNAMPSDLVDRLWNEVAAESVLAAPGQQGESLKPYWSDRWTFERSWREYHDYVKAVAENEYVGGSPFSDALKKAHDDADFVFSDVPPMVSPAEPSEPAAESGPFYIATEVPGRAAPLMTQVSEAEFAAATAFKPSDVSEPLWPPFGACGTRGCIMAHDHDGACVIPKNVAEAIARQSAPAAPQGGESPCIAPRQFAAAPSSPPQGLPRACCGMHPAELNVKSVESDYQFCQLCECESRRRDAETREKELESEVSSLKARVEELEGQQREHEKFLDYFGAKVRESQPDYPPFHNRDYDPLWAISEGYKGVCAANDDLHASLASERSAREAAEKRVAEQDVDLAHWRAQDAFRQKQREKAASQPASAADELDLTQFDGHTPGPWRVFGTNEAGESEIVGPSHNLGHEEWICDTFDFGDRYHAEATANARLIAAAPQLLALARSRGEELANVKQKLKDAMTFHTNEHTDRVAYEAELAEIREAAEKIGWSQESGIPKFLHDLGQRSAIIWSSFSLRLVRCNEAKSEVSSLSAECDRLTKERDNYQLLFSAERARAECVGDLMGEAESESRKMKIENRQLSAELSAARGRAERAEQLLEKMRKWELTPEELASLDSTGTLPAPQPTFEQMNTPYGPAPQGKPPTPAAPEREPCPVCSGVGMVRILDIESPHEVCPHCKAKALIDLTHHFST